MGAIGCVVCLHWLCFYGSIKYSNVSVTLSCLSTASLMTALIEPIFFKKKIKKYQIFLGLMIIPGIYIIFYFTKIYTIGMILGLLAALLSSIFTTLNKSMVMQTKADSMSITFVELGSGLLFLTLLIPFYLRIFPETTLIPSTTDLFYLLILSLVCTVLPYNLSLKSLRHISAFASTFIVNLEPVYGIIMAIIIFKENNELNSGFYLGSLLIFMAIFLYPILYKRFEKQNIIIN